MVILCFRSIEDPLIWSWFKIEKKVEGTWLQVAVLALFVSIWRIRNGVIFEKEKMDEDREFRNFQ